MAFERHHQIGIGSKAIGPWVLALGLSVLAHLPASANQGSGLKLSGFGTVGYWFSNGPDDLRFRRELSQNGPKIKDHHELADSRLGLQANYSLTDKLEAVGQLVFREKAGYNNRDALEWAFLKYQPTHDTDIRLGRIGLDTFMLSDYRSVGYAYNWARPSAEFYGWIPFYSVDGGDISKRWALGEGQLKVKAFAGSTKSGMPWNDQSYMFEASAVGVNASWESDEWRFRLGHTRMRFEKDAPFDVLIPYLQDPTVQTLWPSAAAYADDLKLDGQRLQYTVIGAAWESDGWQIAGEVALTGAKTVFAPQGTSAYLSVARRFGQWVPYVSYARNWNGSALDLTPSPHPTLDGIGTQLNRAYESTHTNQYTASLGVRWDFEERMALKLQWDRSVVSPSGVQMWGDGTVPWRGGSKHVWSAVLDFTF